MPENVVVLDERDIARTYNTPAYEDPYAAVMDYQAVIRYASDHPNRGSSAIANALDIPRSRIRPWLENGSKPDAVRGIELAHEKGWLEAAYLDPEFVALNTLVSNVFSGGSIEKRDYQPWFALNHRQHRSHVIPALEAAGLEFEFFHEDDDERATEVRPTEGATYSDGHSPSWARRSARRTHSRTSRFRGISTTHRTRLGNCSYSRIWRTVVPTTERRIR